MRISSIFPAVITALAAAGFAATDPAPRPVSGLTAPVSVESPRLAVPTAMLLAAIDPLALARRTADDDYR